MFLLSHGHENKSSNFLMFYSNSLARSDHILMSDSFRSLEDTRKRPKISGDACNPFLYWFNEQFGFVCSYIWQTEITLSLFIGQMKSLILFGCVEVSALQKKIGFSRASHGNVSEVVYTSLIIAYFPFLWFYMWRENRSLFLVSLLPVNVRVIVSSWLKKDAVILIYLCF